MLTFVWFLRRWLILSLACLGLLLCIFFYDWLMYWRIPWLRWRAAERRKIAVAEKDREA